MADLGGELAVADGPAVADIRQALEDCPAEPAGELQVDGQVKAVPTPAEVVVELPGRVIEFRGCEQDSRADLLRKRGQDIVVALPRICHPDQAERGRCDQQLADRRIQGAVRDVEQVLLLGTAGDHRAQPPHCRVRCAGRVSACTREEAFEVVHVISLIGRFGSPEPDAGGYDRRRALMPSAALLRAAASLVPMMAATSAYGRSAT